MHDTQRSFAKAFHFFCQCPKRRSYRICYIDSVDTSEQSELCFRPLMPTLEMELYIVWKRYQVFSPAAELLLKEMQREFCRSE